MTTKSAVARILADGDFRALRNHWSDVFPHLPGPESDSDAETALHMARTHSPDVAFRLRAWSHRWLTERDMPSGLPDELKPKAERLYPRVASAVGIAIKGTTKIMQAAAPLIRAAMEHAVLDAEADGRLEDSDFVKARMMEARARETKALFGKLEGRTR